MSQAIPVRLYRLLDRIHRRAAAILYSGTRRRLDQHGLFDSAWYSSTYTEVAQDGWEPLIHYLVIGWRKGYRPHLLFDPDWYLRQQGAGSRHKIPLLDYLKNGARYGLSPSPYLSPYESPDERAGRIIPLKPLAELAGGEAAHLPWSPLIDRDWYLASNPDVAAAGLDPSLHYILSGGREGRSPSPFFDASWYLRSNPDVRDGGFEPLDHFLKTGCTEGRNPHRSFDLDWYVSEHEAEGLTRETAPTSFARHGRALWHSTHRTLPPPGSAAGLWSELPWEGEPLGPEGYRAAGGIVSLLVIAFGDHGSSRATDNIREILAKIARLQGIALHICTTDQNPAPIPNSALLRLPREHPQETRRRLERVLKAARLTGLKHVALVAAGDDDFARLCHEHGIPTLTVADMQDLSEEEIGARISRITGPVPTAHPTVSAIVPNYNHARFLGERLDSILSQRLRPAEIVVLDDASTDDSLAVLREWQSRSTILFTILTNESNSGSPFRQWARGIAHASGDLVWIAESDDRADPHLLERLVPHFADPEVVLAYADSAVIGEAGETLATSYRFYTDDIDRTRWEQPYVVDGSAEIDAALAVKNTIPNASAVLMRRDALQNLAADLGTFRYAGDWWAYAQILRRGRLAYCPEPLNRHRQHAASATPEGERSLGAVKEGLRVRLLLWNAPWVSRRTILHGLAQFVYEFEARTLRHRLDRGGILQQSELSGELEAVRHVLSRRCGPSADTAPLTGWAEALAAQEIGLSADERARLADAVVQTAVRLLRA